MKKLFFIIGEEKSKIFIFFLLTTFLVILETVGIAVLLPIISFFFDTSFSSTFGILVNNILKNFFDLNNLSSIFILILGVFFIKNIIYLVVKWWIYNYSNNLIYKTEIKLITGYINQNLSNIIRTNSSLKLRNIKQETSGLAKYLNSYFSIIIEIIVVIALIFFLFAISYKFTLILFLILGSVSLVFFFLAKKIIYNWGKLRVFYNGKSLKALIEIFNSIKEVKIFGKEIFFKKKYKNFSKKSLNINLKFNTFNETPKMFAELVIIFSLVVIVMIMSNLNFSKSEILSTVTLFAVVGVRITPSISKIINSFNSLKNCQPSLEVIFEQLCENKKIPKVKEEKKYDFKNNITFNDVSYKYDGKNDYILDKSNVTLKKGESIFINGDSGSGKTTFINLLIGLINPTEGKIFIDDKKLVEDNYNYLKIGYVSQNTLLLDDTIENNIVFGEKNEEHFINYKLATDISGINKLKDKYNFSIDKDIGEQGNKISGGQRQRIAIARSIYFNPDIFIFDEATNQLDEEAEFLIFKELISNFKNKTFIFISHNTKLAKLCDRTLIIKNKKIN
ncbi:ABC transporter ATP-binding protein/permease [Candidatus Pelagibacter sp.]|nr:ABC transporter ATP-binding protein/permease [Candidatus Pelagibacter sp.]